MITTNQWMSRSSYESPEPTVRAGAGEHARGTGGGGGGGGGTLSWMK